MRCKGYVVHFVSDKEKTSTWSRVFSSVFLCEISSDIVPLNGVVEAAIVVGFSNKINYLANFLKAALGEIWGYI